ncbi:AP2 domain-containing protein [Paenibacillus barcinonensis]|uniref:AP2 domain-containing protein n=2 Tax=Paenibacillus barcinonensis TaxID=198119 RepID=A0A2V4VDU1_PAEBA|nr:AP2 domain-containing protein [Paenibacillus barcinonensis]
MIIVSYNNAKSIGVMFDDGFVLEDVYYVNFKRGSITNPYTPSLCGVGFMGYGEFDSNYKAHNIWRGMIERCYGTNKTRVKDTSYSDCNVSSDWHNYQNFARWYNDNYYQIDGQVMMLDKDILTKDNKTYSENHCIIAPNSINMLINGRTRTDSGDTPLGVSYHKKTKKYQASCNKNGKPIYLGIYDTPQEAHTVYKQYKEKLIKDIAISLQSKIPDKLFSSLMEYVV